MTIELLLIIMHNCEYLNGLSKIKGVNHELQNS